MKILSDYDLKIEFIFPSLYAHILPNIALHLDMVPSFYMELKPMKCIMRQNIFSRIAKCHALVLWLPFPSTGCERNILKMHAGFGEGSRGRKDSWGARKEGQLCWHSVKSGISSMLWKRWGIGNAEEMPGGTTWFTHTSVYSMLLKADSIWNRPENTHHS